MATWDKDIIFIELVTPVTCDPDEAAYTVKFKPLDGTAYPTNAVTGTQGTSRLDRWYPASDLNDDYCYDVYIDNVKVKRILSPNALPSMGMGVE
jgi:hypothetical protein